MFTPALKIALEIILFCIDIKFFKSVGTKYFIEFELHGKIIQKPYICYRDAIFTLPMDLNNETCLSFVLKLFLNSFDSKYGELNNPIQCFSARNFN